LKRTRGVKGRLATAALSGLLGLTIVTLVPEGTSVAGTPHGGAAPPSIYAVDLVSTACVGAVAFLVTLARMPARTFDRTTGKLTDFVIPI